MFPQTVGAAYLALCSSINTPRSLTCALLWKHGEHDQLLELAINSLDYLDTATESFRDDYLVTEYLRKYPALNVEIDTEEVAIRNFKEAEIRCEAANRRMLWYPGRRASGNLMRVISRAQALIQDTIGHEPKIRSVLDGSKWGKGSTFSLKGEEVRLDAKVLEAKISITLQALPFFRAAVADDYAFLGARGISADGPCSLMHSEFEIVQGSRGLTVPKNAKTDRFIAAEPSGNIFLQLGFGALLRGCLKRVGVNLDSQDWNQVLAEKALQWHLATVDLSAASDTICRELVWLLLPFRWACMLDSCRSRMLKIDDQWIHLQKFSSMGNGFTFELESLIFWALSRAVCDVFGHRGHVSVYGDDIILPDSAFDHLKEVLDYCGFTVNTKKSHWTGLFRESCGKHYFGGCDVSPIYQKETVDCLEAFYRHHNRLVYHCIDRGAVVGSICYGDKKLRDAVRLARFNRLDKPHFLPLQGDIRVRSLDGGLAVSSQSLKRVRFIGCGFRARAWCFIPDAAAADEHAMYAAYARLRGRGVIQTPFFGQDPKANKILRKRAYMEIATAVQLALPFTGDVTLRLRGGYTTEHRVYPHMCDLRWV
jgi:hypothetical protein